ncbi:MAG: hypothetical protein ABI670_19105 [Chloroflexota bacterium]
MRLQSTDTHPVIERIQVEMLRNAGATERVRLARSLSQSVMQMSWSAIQKANPNASDEEISILFVAQNYGDKLADDLRAYLVNRKTVR